MTKITLKMSDAANGIYTVKSWLCIDCGVNTGPGFLAGVQIKMLVALGCKTAEEEFTEDSEVYTVRDNIWQRAGMSDDGGCLCIGCLEKRIGRKLKPKDFERDDPLNHPGLPCSPRLQSRRIR